MSNVQKMYEAHHGKNRAQGFSILKEERGALFAALIGTGKKVLDIGCRDGALTAYFRKDNNVTGVDIDSKALAKAQADLSIETIILDLYSDWHELAGRAFDRAVAGEVLEHLFAPGDIVAKIAKHLTPEGAFVGSVPNAFSLKNRVRLLFARKKYTPLSDPTHVNHFGAGELKALLSKHFEEVEIYGLGKYAAAARIFPGLFAFDLAFSASRKKQNIV